MVNFNFDVNCTFSFEDTQSRENFFDDSDVNQVYDGKFPIVIFSFLQSE